MSYSPGQNKSVRKVADPLFPDTVPYGRSSSASPGWAKLHGSPEPRRPVYSVIEDLKPSILVESSSGNAAGVPGLDMTYLLSAEKGESSVIVNRRKQLLDVALKKRDRIIAMTNAKSGSASPPLGSSPSVKQVRDHSSKIFGDTANELSSMVQTHPDGLQKSRALFMSRDRDLELGQQITLIMNSLHLIRAELEEALTGRLGDLRRYVANEDYSRGMATLDDLTTDLEAPVFDLFNLLTAMEELAVSLDIDSRCLAIRRISQNAKMSKGLFGAGSSSSESEDEANAGHAFATAANETSTLAQADVTLPSLMIPSDARSVSSKREHSSRSTARKRKKNRHGTAADEQQLAFLDAVRQRLIKEKVEANAELFRARRRILKLEEEVSHYHSLTSMVRTREWRLTCRCTILMFKNSLLESQLYTARQEIETIQLGFRSFHELKIRLFSQLRSLRTHVPDVDKALSEYESRPSTRGSGAARSIDDQLPLEDMIDAFVEARVAKVLVDERLKADELYRERRRIEDEIRFNSMPSRDSQTPPELLTMFAVSYLSSRERTSVATSIEKHTSIGWARDRSAQASFAKRNVGLQYCFSDGQENDLLSVIHHDEPDSPVSARSLDSLGHEEIASQSTTATSRAEVAKVKMYDFSSQACAIMRDRASGSAIRMAAVCSQTVSLAKEVSTQAGDMLSRVRSAGVATEPWVPDIRPSLGIGLTGPFYEEFFDNGEEGPSSGSRPSSRPSSRQSSYRSTKSAVGRRNSKSSGLPSSRLYPDVPSLSSSVTASRPSSSPASRAVSEKVSSRLPSASGRTATSGKLTEDESSPAVVSAPANPPPKALLRTMRSCAVMTLEASHRSQAEGHAGDPRLRDAMTATEEDVFVHAVIQPVLQSSIRSVATSTRDTEYDMPTLEHATSTSSLPCSTGTSQAVASPSVDMESELIQASYSMLDDFSQTPAVEPPPSIIQRTVGLQVRLHIPTDSLEDGGHGFTVSCGGDDVGLQTEDAYIDMYVKQMLADRVSDMQRQMEALARRNSQLESEVLHLQEMSHTADMVMQRVRSLDGENYQLKVGNRHLEDAYEQLQRRLLDAQGALLAFEQQVFYAANRSELTASRQSGISSAEGVADKVDSRQQSQSHQHDQKYDFLMMRKHFNQLVTSTNMHSAEELEELKSRLAVAGTRGHGAVEVKTDMSDEVVASTIASARASEKALDHDRSTVSGNFSAGLALSAKGYPVTTMAPSRSLHRRSDTTTEPRSTDTVGSNSAAPSDSAAIRMVMGYKSSDTSDGSAGPLPFSERRLNRDVADVRLSVLRASQQRRSHEVQFVPAPDLNLSGGIRKLPMRPKGAPSPIPNATPGSFETPLSSSTVAPDLFSAALDPKSGRTFPDDLAAAEPHPQETWRDADFDELIDFIDELEPVSSQRVRFHSDGGELTKTTENVPLLPEEGTRPPGDPRVAHYFVPSSYRSPRPTQELQSAAQDNIRMQQAMPFRVSGLNVYGPVVHIRKYRVVPSSRPNVNHPSSQSTTVLIRPKY